MSLAPRAFVNSLPKSGTNLLTSILRELPGLRFRKLPLNRQLRLHPMNHWPLGDRRRCRVGMDQPHEVRMVVVGRLFDKLRPGTFTAGHVPYHADLAALLADKEVRTILVWRDPRDVLVSQVFHIMGRRRHFLHEAYARLPTERDRLLAAIRGIPDNKGGMLCEGLGSRLQAIRGWTLDPAVLTLRFEDLIGRRGGGDPDRQQRTLCEIVRHLGLGVSLDEASRAFDRAFGQGGTFRRGMIGGWRDHFDDLVTRAFMLEAGDWLPLMGYKYRDPDVPLGNSSS